MSGTHNSKMIYRCPVCFVRENDVVLKKRNDGTYYCIKCSFTGTKEEIIQMYDDSKKKYRLMKKRITLEMLENDFC